MTIQEIRELLNKITPGEWYCTPYPSRKEWCQWIRSKDSTESVACSVDKNCTFIAAAPSIISQLLEERDTLKKKIQAMVIIKQEMLTPFDVGHNLGMEKVLGLFEE